MSTFLVTALFFVKAKTADAAVALAALHCDRHNATPTFPRLYLDESVPAVAVSDASATGGLPRTLVDVDAIETYLRSILYPAAQPTPTAWYAQGVCDVEFTNAKQATVQRYINQHNAALPAGGSPCFHLRGPLPLYALPPAFAELIAVAELAAKVNPFGSVENAAARDAAIAVLAKVQP